MSDERFSWRVGFFSLVVLCPRCCVRVRVTKRNAQTVWADAEMPTDQPKRNATKLSGPRPIGTLRRRRGIGAVCVFNQRL